MKNTLSQTGEENWEILGRQLIGGYKVDEIQVGGQKFIFNPKQVEFISNWKDRFCLYSGGYGSGKSLALYIKLILAVKCFPGNRILLGRRTLSDIERAILPDLFEIIPRNWYEHRVKDAVINFSNKSQIILFGLDALQQGDMADIKKAQQKLKSINLGGAFIDQLEEVEYEVFNTIDTRMRRNIPMRQFNATTNPANYWGYHFFIEKKSFIDGTWEIPSKTPDNRAYYQGSMLDNKDNLPEDYIEAQLAKEERFVQRYVYGIWTPEILTERAVFAQEHVDRFARMEKKPIAVEEGCKIWKQPLPYMRYQMGVDPSEGVVDPSSISVISVTGEKVAKFNGKIPIPGLAEKIKFLYYKYNEPLIVPEVNQAAILEHIRDLKVYQRTQFEYRTKKTTKKLGFKTSYQSKSALINHFVKLSRENFPIIYDSGTISQMRTFVWADEAKHKGAGAQRGFHDDDIISTLLAYWELEKPKRREEREPIVYDPKSKITGY